MPFLAKKMEPLFERNYSGGERVSESCMSLQAVDVFIRATGGWGDVALVRYLMEISCLNAGSLRGIVHSDFKFAVHHYLSAGSGDIF